LFWISKKKRGKAPQRNNRKQKGNEKLEALRKSSTATKEVKKVLKIPFS
jgi:hypothetical protein